MPEPLTPAQVEAVAALAQLALTPAEVELFARQLGEILAYVGELQQVDTSTVPPTFGVTGRGADRPDQVVPSLGADDVFANAPDSQRPTSTAQAEGGFFRVPRVIG